MWIDTYIGPPDNIIHDAGTNFASKEFKQHTNSFAIITKAAPVEAHWSIGIVERYHPVLKRAYTIIIEQLPDLAKTAQGRGFALQMAVKAVNDTAGPDGLVPTLLVFGAYPKMSQLDPPAPTISQRATAVRKAMEEVSKLRAKRLVQDALNQRNGPNVSNLHNLPIGSKVLTWREGNTGQSGKWTGPHTLLDIQGETCHVKLEGSDKITHFRSTVVKPFLQENCANKVEDTNEITEDGNSNTSPQDSQQMDANNEANDTPKPHQRPQRTIRLPERFRQDIIYLAVSLPTNLTKPSLPFVESRRKEINGLLERGVFEIVNKSSVPDGVRIFNSRFVDEVKNPGTSQAFEKSRLVVQAYNDTEKSLILTQSPTIQRASQRLLLAITAILHNDDIKLYLRDITQAYCQSATTLKRDFFVRPPPELGLDSTQILRIVKPLYGVPEAGNHWFNTYHRHHVEKLGMKQSTFDPCLLTTCTADDSKAFGLVGLQTDDTLLLANNIFAQMEESELQKAKLTSKPREQLICEKPLKFNGGIITLTEPGNILLTQAHQCKGIRAANPSKSTDIVSSRGMVRKSINPKGQYVAMRAKGAYIASICQPEASFDLSYAAQITDPQAKDIKHLNKRLQWQYDNDSRGLTFIRLDPNSIQLVAFTDSSFANNHDLSSQIGFVIALAEKNGKQGLHRANIIHWSSVKCKRITRSVLASELYAMAYGFDIAAVIKSTAEKILCKPIPLALCTDSKSLYDCLVKLGTTREKRLMIDLMCLRQAYERREVAEVKWIDGDSNPADAMTKSKPCQALKDLIDTNLIRLNTEEWVEREG
jgi:Reverse transcriptase (RNA-dependent DNA polymerase)